MSRIERVTAHALAYPEPHYRGLERCVTLVRIDTNDGLTGWGEGVSQFHEAARATNVIVSQGMAPLLVGEDPMDVERHWHTMCRHAYWYGVEGVAAFAISAVDMALWDLKGKLLDQPVATLLGGQLRDEVPAMASIIFDMDSLDWTLAEFATFKERGYQIVKAGWGMRSDAMFGQNRRRDFEFVREVRQVIGDDISLVVDVPGARGLWDVPTAIRRVSEFEQFDLRWVEQPLPPHDLEGYARLRASVKTPIGAGEDEWSPESYRHVVARGAVDVLQLDPGRCLGLTGCRETIKLAESFGVRYSAHSWSSALNTAASVHMLSISPNGDTLDFKPHESPMQHELVHDPWSPRDGMLTIRSSPGLGVAVREDAIAKYEMR